MKFEKIVESPIIEELWKNEREEFEKYYVDKRETKIELYKNGLIQDEMITMVKEFLPEETMKEYEKKWKEYCDKYIEELFYWSKQYFKLGIFNGIRLKNELNLEENQAKETCYKKKIKEIELNENLKIYQNTTIELTFERSLDAKIKLKEATVKYDYKNGFLTINSENYHLKINTTLVNSYSKVNDEFFIDLDTILIKIKKISN